MKTCILFAALSFLFVACDTNGAVTGDRVNDVFVGWEGLTEDDGSTPVYEADLNNIAHNSIVVANDGSAEIGMFNDECIVRLPATGVGWQDVAHVCVIPQTGDAFVMHKAAILFYGTTYSIVIEGEYENRRVSYGATMGSYEH